MRLPSRGHQHPVDHVDETPTVPLPVGAPGPEARPLTVLDRLGGPWGLIGTGAPQVVFAVVTNFASLPVTAGVSLAVAVVFAVVRKVRGDPTSTALGGVLGVGIASAVAIWTGSASNYFLVGIVASLICFIGTAGSLAVRRPVTGLMWNALHGGGHPWREDRPSRRAHDIATSAAAVMFGARFVVTQWLYSVDSTSGLAIARVAMGVPLTAAAAIVAFWAFRRTTNRLVTPVRVAAERERAAAGKVGGDRPGESGQDLIPSLTRDGVRVMRAPRRAGPGAPR